MLSDLNVIIIIIMGKCVENSVKNKHNDVKVLMVRH